ncbi:hypothetical protein J6590_102880, partial [Homalodisca vitripennis]
KGTGFTETHWRSYDARSHRCGDVIILDSKLSKPFLALCCVFSGPPGLSLLGSF